MDLAFADERKGQMGQLHQIAAGPDGAVTRDHRVNSPVEELDEQVGDRDMDARIALHERTQTGHDHGPHVGVAQRVAGARGVAADDVVLQFGEMPVADAPLRHRSEPGVDAVDDLVGGESFQEIVTRPDSFSGAVGQGERFVPGDDSSQLLQ